MPFFAKQYWHSDEFGLRSPAIQKKKIEEMCYYYLCRRMRLLSPDMPARECVVLEKITT